MATGRSGEELGWTRRCGKLFKKTSKTAADLSNKSTNKKESGRMSRPSMRDRGRASFKRDEGASASVRIRQAHHAIWPSLDHLLVQHVGTPAKRVWGRTAHPLVRLVTCSCMSISIHSICTCTFGKLVLLQRGIPQLCRTTSRFSTREDERLSRASVGWRCTSTATWSSRLGGLSGPLGVPVVATVGVGSNH